jgi:hypothetical protein
MPNEARSIFWRVPDSFASMVGNCVAPASAL